MIDHKALTDLPWMAAAVAEIGVTEIPGKDHEQRILEYWEAVGINPASVGSGGDETPWCAIFLGAMLSEAGYPFLKSAQARAYSNYGAGLEKPYPGAIIILNRPGGHPWQGHVGFCTGVDGDDVFLVAGNQGNRVSVASFSITARFASARWPVPDVRYGLLTSPIKNPTDR